MLCGSAGVWHRRKPRQHWRRTVVETSQGLGQGPGFGAQLVGVTRTGARIFAEEMHKQRPAHFDAFIFELGMHRMQDNSCYVYPAVGNFDAHESGTTPGIRESMFEKHWMLGQPVIPGPGW